MTISCSGNMVTALFSCLFASVVMCVVEGDSFSDRPNNSIMNCTDVNALALSIPSLFFDDVPGFELSQMIQCEENVTMDVSSNILDGDNYVSSTTNESHPHYKRNQTDEQRRPSTADWLVIFEQVEFATRGIFLPTTQCLGFIGNILFIIVLSKGYVKSNSSVYLLGLASSNLCSLFLGSPWFLRPYKAITALRSYKTFYAFFLSYILPLFVSFQTSGKWVVLLLTIERFVAVTFPMKAQRYSTGKRSKIAVCSAFVLGFALNFVRFFRRKVIRKIDPITGEHYYSHTLTELARNKTVDAVTFISHLIFNDIIPFLLLLVLNTIIIHRVWRARFTRMKMTETQNRKEQDRANREHQITRLLVAIVVAFLLCNLLSSVGSIYAALNSFVAVGNTFTPFVYYIYSLGLTLANINPFVNCILYAVCNDTMRNGIVSLIFGRKPVKTHTVKITNTNTRDTTSYQ